jgi:alkaline phosphatase D
MTPGSVFSIWDDHDFLWNDAEGADIARQPKQRDKIALSTLLQAAFRRALALGLPPGGFPVQASHPSLIPTPADPPLDVPSIDLGGGVWLHLTDGRTQRTARFLVRESKRSILGAAQREQLSSAMAVAASTDIHLFASGSTLAAYKPYPVDWAWLKDLAASHRTLVLSGDIHRNNSGAFETGGFALHEATSSGVAIRDAVVVGKTRQNYGLLDIDADGVTVQFFERGKLANRLRIDRVTWALQ